MKEFEFIKKGYNNENAGGKQYENANRYYYTVVIGDKSAILDDEGSTVL